MRTKNSVTFSHMEVISDSTKVIVLHLWRRKIRNSVRPRENRKLWIGIIERYWGFFCKGEQKNGLVFKGKCELMWGVSPNRRYFSMFGRKQKDNCNRKNFMLWARGNKACAWEVWLWVGKGTGYPCKREGGYTRRCHLGYVCGWGGSRTITGDEKAKQL